MTPAPQRDEAACNRTWRVGTHYNIHVYEGETPIATALMPEYAEQIVRDHNMPQRDAHMSDVEKAREALHLMETELPILQGAHCPDYRAKAFRSLIAHVDTALRALGERGEPETEVWDAGMDPNNRGDWAVFRVTGGHRALIAGGLRKETAERIARLPALERAARDLASRIDASHGCDIDVLFARDALRDALEQEPGQ